MTEFHCQQCYSAGHWDVLSCVAVCQGRIEEELRYVVIEAAARSGGAVHLGRLALPLSSLVLTQPA
jgi:hypothetical protein